MYLSVSSQRFSWRPAPDPFHENHALTHKIVGGKIYFLVLLKGK